MTPIPAILRLAVAAVPAAMLPTAMAVPGDVDLTFNPNAGARVLCTAVQGGGKIIVAGDFTSIGGQPRSRIARLNANGTLDSEFIPDVNDTVTCVAVLADGDVLIGGEFTAVGSVPRQRMARLNENGTVDLEFEAVVSGGGSPTVYAVAPQADGKLVIGGTFTSVGGSGRNRIARVNANGALDTAFNPGAGGTVRTVVVQPDGKIVLGGQFGTVAGGNRNFLARLDAAGVLEAGFDPGMNNFINCVAVQRDGKLLVGGDFTSVGTEVRTYFARFDATGRLETGFNPAPNGPVRSIVLQLDGKILIGGEFVSLGTTARNRIARLGADGALETAFNPDAGGPVYSLSLQGDGKVVAGGTFTSVGGQSRNRLARLENDSATESLTIPNVTRVQWLRSGATAEALGVQFQVAAPEGGPWTPLGEGSRINGGWELTGQNLPAAGRMRAVASTIGGQYNGSPGVVDSVAPFLFEPEIAVEQPEGTDLTSGTAKAKFGSILTGTSKPLTFKILNKGLHNLTGLGISFGGKSAAEFTASEPATTVAAGDDTFFTVTLTSSVAGAKEAVLVLNSNDTNENPFQINLEATVLVPEADADNDGMTNAAEVMLTASGFDPLTNSAAKIAQLRASGVYPASDIHALALTQPVLERDALTGQFLLRTGVEKSADLSEWTLFPETVDFVIEPDGAGPWFYRVFGKRP